MKIRRSCDHLKFLMGLLQLQRRFYIETRPRSLSNSCDSFEIGFPQMILHVTDIQMRCNDSTKAKQTKPCGPHYGYQGHIQELQNDIFPDTRNPLIQIKRPWDRLIVIMGIPIWWRLYTEIAPSYKKVLVIMKHQTGDDQPTSSK